MQSILVVTDQQYSTHEGWVDYLKTLLADFPWLGQPEASWQLVNFPEKLLIDDVRGLQTQLSTINTAGNYVFVLTDFQQASGVVQNALLKSLEEPPQAATIIAVTNTLGPILDTTQSRCRIIRDRQTENVTSDLYPTLADLQIDTWPTLNASQLAQLITTKFSDNQKALKKTHPDLTQTAVTIAALTSYLQQLTRELDASKDLAWQTKVIGALTESLRLLRANVSFKNVYYFLAIEVTKS